MDDGLWIMNDELKLVGGDWDLSPIAI